MPHRATCFDSCIRDLSDPIDNWALFIKCTTEKDGCIQRERTTYARYLPELETKRSAQASGHIELLLLTSGKLAKPLIYCVKVPSLTEPSRY